MIASQTLSVLLHRSEALLAAVAERSVGARRTLELLAITVAGTAAYGAAVGSYVGGSQIVHAAVKMPILFLGTLGLGFLLLHIVGAACGTGMTLAQTAQLCLVSVAVTGIVLAALAPVVAFVSCCAAYPSYPTYLFLWLCLFAAIAVAGFVSLGYLVRGMRRAAMPGARIARTIVCWLAVYHVVGAQMAWLLRPWVGDNRDVVGGFSLERNFQGNVYEALGSVAATWIRALLETR